MNIGLFGRVLRRRICLSVEGEVADSLERRGEAGDIRPHAIDQ